MTSHDLRRWRQSRGLSQEQAAYLLGIDARTYQWYERETFREALFGRWVPLSIAASVHGVSEAVRLANPIVASARFERDPWGGAYRTTAMQFRPHNTYPEYAVRIYLAKLLLDGKPIAAGKHKTGTMSFRIDTPVAARRRYGRLLKVA